MQIKLRKELVFKYNTELEIALIYLVSLSLSLRLQSIKNIQSQLNLNKNSMNEFPAVYRGSF